MSFTIGEEERERFVHGYMLCKAAMQISQVVSLGKKLVYCLETKFSVWIYTIDR